MARNAVVWRKPHLAADSKTHEIICADLSLNNATDQKLLPGLYPANQGDQAASADGALRHPALTMNWAENQRAYPAPKGAVTGPVNMQQTGNRAVISG